MREYCLEGYRFVASAHYDFYFRPGSLAEKEIVRIMQVQEESYAKIVRLLRVEPGFRIRYVLCESAWEVGRVYGDNEPCNGFADFPDTVFAVYTEEVKCIGPHEDTHLIAELIAHPESNFIREGLAMYMDEVWWDKPNVEWVSKFVRTDQMVSISSLFDRNAFFSQPEEITYPLAGAFTLWLIETLGMKTYLQRIYVSGHQSIQDIEKVFGASIVEAERSFLAWIAEK